MLYSRGAKQGSPGQNAPAIRSQEVEKLETSLESISFVQASSPGSSSDNRSESEEYDISIGGMVMGMVGYDSSKVAYKVELPAVVFSFLSSSSSLHQSIDEFTFNQ